MLSILIVDDEQIERNGVKLLISRYNMQFNIFDAENGKEALEVLSENHIDILFTDIKMPFMDGLELCKNVSRDYKDIKIIIFSAYGEFEYAKKAISFNVFSYILKPIDVSEFYNVLSDAVKICNRTDNYTQSIIKDDKTENHDSSKKVIRDVLNIIDKNYMNDISLEWIAHKVYLTETYLSYLFRKETGESFIKYITRIRMDKAKELLRKTNMKVTDISKEVGYSNNSYFCINFKSHFGISPARFREMEK